MLKRIIILKNRKSFLRRMRLAEWAILKKVKLCRLKKNMILAGIGALVCSAVGGITIAFVVAFLSSIVEEIYDIEIYDKKLSINIAVIVALFKDTFSLNSIEEPTHPRDNMLPKGDTSILASTSISASSDHLVNSKNVA